MLLCWATRLYFCQWKKSLKSQRRTSRRVLSIITQQWQDNCWHINNLLGQASIRRSCADSKTGSENWLGILLTGEVPKSREKYTVEIGTRASWETKGAWLKGARFENENWVWEEELWKQGQGAKYRLLELNSKSAKWACQ